MLFTNVLVTAYCSCKLCCSMQHGITASGTKPTVCHTIAAPRTIKLGTRIEIEGRKYVVEDRTSKKFDGRWDIYMIDHKAAKKFGMKILNVKILK